MTPARMGALLPEILLNRLREAKYMEAMHKASTADPARRILKNWLKKHEKYSSMPPGRSRNESKYAGFGMKRLLSWLAVRTYSPG